MKHIIILEEWNRSKGDLILEQDYGTRLIIDGKIISEDVSTISAINDILTTLGIEFDLQTREEKTN